VRFVWFSFVSSAFAPSWRTFAGKSSGLFIRKLVMSSKKTKQITVHLPESMYLRVARFAEKDGMADGVYVRNLIASDIQKKLDDLRMLQQLLEVDGSFSSDSADSSAD
jgi:predicted DNA-binding protein